MKKFKLLIVLVICFLILNVKADMGPPSVIEHEVMVTNKDGAICYDDGKKTKEVIPYGTTFTINMDVINGFINVNYKGNSCDVRSSDISSKTQKFSLDNKEVEKITPVKAIILSSNGLNMRKGPAVTYAKIMTVPNKAIVKLTHKSGSYWYYCEYNDYAGWISGMDGYFGYDGKEVLYSSEPMKIYSTYDKKSVLAKIPANTEITDYVNLVTRSDYEISHLVKYNGTVGYVEKMMYKTDGTGKIKLIKNFDVTNNVGELIKKLTPQELEYNMVNAYGGMYLLDKKIVAYIPEEYFEYIKKADVLIKTKGYIGEEIFGEKKEEKLSEKENETNEESYQIKNKDNKEPTSVNTKDVIIICLLAGIFLALTTLVIIKLVNNKKKVIINNQDENEYNNKEV